MARATTTTTTTTTRHTPIKVRMKLAARARAGAVEAKREPTGAMAAAAKDGRDEKDDDDDAKRAMDLHRSLNRASDRAAREREVARGVEADAHHGYDPGILPSC